MSTLPNDPAPPHGTLARADLPKPPVHFSTKLHRYRFLLAKFWWILFLTVSAALALQAWRTVSTPAKYLSVGRMMVSGQFSLPNSVGVYNEEQGAFYGTQVELMQSETVRLAAVARMQALHPEIKATPVALTVTRQPNTSIFVLQTIGDQPQYTQAFLDACMQEYINAKKGMRSQKSDTTLSAITDELKVLEKEIKAGDDALISFQKQYNVNFLKDQGNSAGSYLSTLDNKLASLNTEYQLLNLLNLDQNIDRQQTENAQKPATTGTAAATPTATLGAGLDIVAGGFAPQTDYTKAKQELQLLKAQLADFSQYLRPKHPRIVSLNEQISLQERLIDISRQESKTQLNERRESVRLQIENLKNERKEWSAKALELSGHTAEYETLQSRVDRSKKLYDSLRTSMEAVGVNRNIDQDMVSVLENASTPSSIKPGLPKALAAALVGGLATGAAILFLLDTLDDRLISIAEFEGTFSERILGRISREGVKDLAIIQPEDPRHIFAESFSNLRSSLLYLPYEGGRPRSILVTSAVPNEGKSTVSSNLAVTLAMGGPRTLLVDCDLRRGNIHTLFGLSNTSGLSEILTKNTPWRETVQQSNVANLSVIPCGKPLAQPAKNLLSNIIDEFLKETYGEFEFVIFDTCPVLAADDTTTLAPKLDASIFVVRLSFSRRSGSRTALGLLYDRQVNVLGVVLNGLNPSVDGYHYYSYSDYYSSNVKS